MQKSKIKKISTFSVYILFFVYIIFVYLMWFGVIKTNNFVIVNTFIEKINNLTSIILVVLLIIKSLILVSTNEQELIKNKNINALVKKENLKLIFKLSILLLPFIAIKLIFLNNLDNTLPISTQIMMIVFLVMSIILVGLLIYIIVIFIFKKIDLLKKQEKLIFHYELKITNLVILKMMSVIKILKLFLLV